MILFPPFISLRIYFDSIFKFQEDQDWGIVAMVLDRLFLWTFGTVALVGSLIILSDSPFIYDSIVPIDVKYSKIAEIEEKMYQRALS